MQIMIIDIIQTIIDHSGKLFCQIKCMKMNKYIYENTYIYSLHRGEKNQDDFDHIGPFDREYINNIKKITQEVIEQKKYSRLVRIDFSPEVHYGGINKKVSSVNHLAYTLKYLNCSWDCGINQAGISKLKKIEILLCDGNKKIEYVGHLADVLEVLNCGHSCKIGQNSISKLNKLKVLRMDCNDKIKDVNHLNNTLIELRCGFSRLAQDGISKLEHLKIFNFRENSFIHNINHLKSIEELYCGTEIDTSGIIGLKNVKKLSLGSNGKIKCVDHLMETLEELIHDTEILFPIDKMKTKCRNAEIKIITRDRDPYCNQTHHYFIRRDSLSTAKVMALLEF